MVLVNIKDKREHFILQPVQLHLISIQQQRKLNVYHTKKLPQPCFSHMIGLLFTVHCRQREYYHGLQYVHAQVIDMEKAIT